MTERKVEIISRKTIRPSSPTPHHQKNFKLSLLDQRAPPNLYATMIFFYSASNSSIHNHKQQMISNHLQKSLSETLVHFYPFAGRFKDAVSIECNDEGASFVEAQINCHLLDVLSQLEPNLLLHFIPTTYTLNHDSLDALMHVQLTVFNCGGIALGVSISHKVADALSLCTFVQCWTAAARHEYDINGHDHQILLPDLFSGPSLMPASDRHRLITFTPTLPALQNFTTRRFVFSSFKMASLKAKISRLLLDQKLGIINGPTNVELVYAVVIKCAINAVAASQSISSPSRPSLVSQAVNLRKRMVPPLPHNSMGNLVSQFHLLVEKNDIELHELVVKMRKGLTDFCNDKVNRFKGEDGFSMVCESVKEKDELHKMGVNFFGFSSLCGFPLYDTDLGWGKPIWVTCPMFFNHFFILSKWGEDIEAWVSLEEQVMTIFERDDMLLSLASLNPSAIVSRCSM